MEFALVETALRGELLYVHLVIYLYFSAPNAKVFMYSVSKLKVFILFLNGRSYLGKYEVHILTMIHKALKKLSI